MWDSFLDRILRRMLRQGSMRLTYPSGRVCTYGCGEPEVAVSLSDPALPRRLVLSPELAVGEAYMDGTLVIEGDDLHGFLALMMSNPGGQATRAALGSPGVLLQRLRRRIDQFNPVGRARANVAHHYDLSGALYDLFLDRDRQYSCAYFRDPGDSLDQAQRQKIAHVARKLCLIPGQRVLDIGCGWGGLALALARDHGARVVGVTLSTEQHAVATRRARDAGLSDRVEFRLQDYRHVPGTFDRIVSVGMFEHVGAPHFRSFFGHLRDRLAPGGVALLHTIGRSDGPGATSSWIRRYIFPGGYCPSLSETVAAIEQEALMVADVEVWRLHYARTLRHWHDRFMANHAAARALYDDRFCRMWRFYLAAAEMTFRHRGQVVFQIQLCRDQRAVPLTRDYLYRPDAAMRRAAE